MANTYRFPSGGLAEVADEWQIAFTVASEFDAAAITGCLVTNRTGGSTQEEVAFNVAIFDESEQLVRYWAENWTAPWGVGVEVIKGTQNLPTGWSIRARSAIAGAIDISVSAIGIVYG